MPTFTRREFVTGLVGAATLSAYPVKRWLDNTYELPRTWPVTKYSPGELRKLRVSFYDPVDPSGFFDPKRFFPKPMHALFEGMKKHGLNLSWAKFNEPTDADLAVIPGWFQKKAISHYQQQNKNVLIIEQGNIQPRYLWPSLGFNGLIGYATYAPTPDDGGERFNKNFGHYLQEWQRRPNGYALLIGQMPKDMSLHGLDMYRWLQEMTDKLTQKNVEVIYRPHPSLLKASVQKKKQLFVPSGASLSSTNSLADDLAGAAYTVIYTSTTAVESILSGVPAVVMCKGCAGWDVASHDLEAPFYYPDRTGWCNDLAWRQWTLEELRSGVAWEYTNAAMK